MGSSDIRLIVNMLEQMKGHEMGSSSLMINNYYGMTDFNLALPLLLEALKSE